MTRGKWFLSFALAIALAGGGYWAVERGLQTCGWLDVILGRSGCLGSVRVEGVVPMRGNPDVPFTAKGEAILAVDTRTADGWRNALLVLDPASGREAGRYPVPLSNTNMQVLPEPDGQRLLLLCGVIEANCTDTGSDGILVDRDNLHVFNGAPDADRYFRVFPGVPLPDAEYGYEARFALGGERIVTNRRNEGVVLLDAEGEQIAELSTQFVFSSRIVISPDGTRIMRWQSGYENGDNLHIWDATDGRALGHIDGSPDWTLRAPPFWSADGSLIFTPRKEGSAMLLDRFAAP